MRAKKSGSPFYTRLISLLLCGAIAATLIPNVPFTLGAENNYDEAENTYTISTFDEFTAAVGFSRNEKGQRVKYILKNDINFTSENMEKLAGLDIEHLTFGSEEFPFLGEFDGGSHTITGLNYDNNLFKVATRTGLFSYVGDKNSSATPYIHDVTIKDASIHADMITGIVAGEAYNARFENVNVVDSAVSVNPADNAVLLITDGGVIGGGLVGYANNCYFYNCEVNRTAVRTNSVSGVAALAGKGLYLGGLVGAMDDGTVVEYCRVTRGREEAGHAPGKVSNRYESSVGALGGFTCYAGGLAGEMEGGSKLIDCFATCDVSFYAATYVGVGAGCSGKAAGLVARVNDDGGGGTITRCHYAGGTISSFQYNTLLLMIPVQISKDVNRSGLAEACDDENKVHVTSSYFNYTDGIGPDSKKPANVLGNKTTSANFAPLGDERYMDRSFWESRGYDFAGAKDRSGESPLWTETHSNKWVMYYYNDPVLDKYGNQVIENGVGKTVRRGYPIHGLSVAATFDFPGAGEVTLAPTLGKDSLSLEPVSTKDPYRFAVLGIHPTEQEVTEYTDSTPTKGGVSLSSVMNEGYRLVNWYLEPDVAAAGLPIGQHAFFEEIFNADPSKIQPDLVVNNPEAVNPHVAVKDGQLYVARCQARVRFHDVNGGSIDVDGAARSEGTTEERDWYFYGKLLPDVQPDTAPGSSTARLIGWTTTPYVDGGVNKGYKAIDSITLNNLKRQNAFYEAGDPVTKTMELYPVYTDLKSNIFTQYEGYELDSAPEDKTKRAGYGHTSVDMTDGVATVHVTGDNAGKFPKGVRFLGWYELKDGEPAHLVSREKDFTLTDVDLTVPHTYEARFEYQVQFWLPEKTNKSDVRGLSQYTYLLQDVYVKYGTKLFKDEWNSDYLANFDYNRDALTHKFLFSHWTDENVKYRDDGNLRTYHGSTGSGGLDEIQGTAHYDTNTKVAAPLDLYGIFSEAADLFKYSNYVTTDFPLSATVKIENNDYTNKKVSAVVRDGYNYIFWDMYGKTATESDIWGGKWSDSGVTPDPDAKKVTWATDQNVALGGEDYTLYYTAHMTADVNFHQAGDSVESPTAQLVGTRVTLTSTDYPYLSGNKMVSMTRRYRSPVFGTALKNEYDSYQDDNPNILTFEGNFPEHPPKPIAEQGTAPSRENMKISGYYFVGWFEPAAWMPADRAYFLDVDPEPGEPKYQSSSVGLCQPYVLPDNAVVEHAMDLYPVYVKYNIKTATNVKFEGGGVQKPRDPIYRLENDTDVMSATVTVTAYDHEPVQTGSSDTYTIEYITVSVDGGEAEVITSHTTDGDNWVVTYPVDPGKEYLFTAVYRPYVVVFHRNGSTDPAVLVRDFRQPIGRPADGPVLPTATVTESAKALFVGWTETTPGNERYHFKSTYDEAKKFGFWTIAETEATLVTHSMELWPVYADYTVSVKSNIDNELTGKDVDPETVRTLRRDSANTVTVSAPANEEGIIAVGGEEYKFAGWYTGVKPVAGEYNDFSQATLVSEEKEYALEGGEPFSGQIYTAQYKKVYKVIYHNRGKYLGTDKDPVIYTRYLYEGEDEDKALNMETTEMVDQPVYVDGKPQFNEDGTLKTEKKPVKYHQPLDSEPYDMIYATMDPHESFGQWECHDPDGSATGELVNVYPYSFDKLLPQKNGEPGLMARVGTKPREINLYPTVWTVTVTDPAGNDIIETGQAKVEIDMSGMDPHSTEYENVKVYVCFDPAKPYTQEKLTVRVRRTRWVETDEVNKPNIANRGRNDVEVFLYRDPAKTEMMAAPKMTDNLNDPALTDADKGGYAVFNFDTSKSRLQIVKKALPEDEGETFLFEVKDNNDPNNAWTVPVTCGTAVTDDEDNVTGWTGQADLTLPVGTYSVTEAEGWAWRQEPTYAVYIGGKLQTAPGAPHTEVYLAPIVTEARAAGIPAAQVVCTNGRLDEKSQWLVRTGSKKNLFQQPDAPPPAAPGVP